MKRSELYLPAAAAGAAVLLAAVLLLGPVNGAKRAMAGIGEASGRAVGTAVGSFEGFTKGMKEGAEAGKAAGLAADDITAELKNSMRRVANLEVLAAGVRLRDVEKKGADYAALHLLKGTAVFSADLSRAEVSVTPDGSVVTVTIPEPEMRLYIDAEESEKIAEYQRNYFSGTADAGFEAYLNSMARTAEEAEEQIADHEALREEARAAAVTEIRMLANALLGNAKTVRVEFSESGGGA